MSSNHRDGPDYNESKELDHPCKRTCSGWSQGFDRGAFEYNALKSGEIQELQKEVQRLAAENEAYMSTDYWFERHKDVKAQLDDAQEWLVAKDDQIEHLVDFGDRMEEQRDALVLALVRLAGKPEQAKAIAEKALSIQARAQKRE